MSIWSRPWAIFPALALAAALDDTDACALLQTNIGTMAGSSPEENIEGAEVYKPAGDLLMQAQKALDDESNIMMYVIQRVSDEWPYAIENFLKTEVMECSDNIVQKTVMFGDYLKADNRKNISVLTSTIKQQWEAYRNDQVTLLEGSWKTAGSLGDAAHLRKAYIDAFIKANNHTRSRGLEQNQTALETVENMLSSLERAYNATTRKLLHRRQRRVPITCLQTAQAVGISSLWLYNCLRNSSLAAASEIFRFNEQLQSISRLAYETPTPMNPTDKLHAMFVALNDEVDKHVPAMIKAFEMVLEELKDGAKKDDEHGIGYEGDEEGDEEDDAEE